MKAFRLPYHGSYSSLLRLNALKLTRTRTLVNRIQQSSPPFQCVRPFSNNFATSINRIHSRSLCTKSTNADVNSVAKWEQDDELIVKHPALGTIEEYIRRAERFLSEGEVDDALEDLSAALEIDGNEPNIYVLRAFCHENKQDYQSALEDYNKVIALAPDNIPSYASIARCYQILGKDDLALSWYDQVLLAEPKYAPAYGGRGDVYFSRKQFTQAMEDYQQVLRYDPGNAMALSSIARIHLFNHDPHKARTTYELTVRRDPKNVEAWAGIGVTEYVLDNYEKSIVAYSRALELTPNDPDLLCRRGAAYSKLNKLREALDDVEESLRYSPADHLSIGLRGAIHCEMKNYRKAVDDLEDYFLVPLAEEKPDTMKQDSEIWLKLSESHYHLFLESNPQYEEVKVSTSQVDNVTSKDLSLNLNNLHNDLKKLSKAKKDKHLLRSMEACIMSIKLHEHNNSAKSFAVTLKEVGNKRKSELSTKKEKK